MHRGFFLPVKAFPPAPNGPGTGGGRCHATYLCGERFNSRPPRGGRQGQDRSVLQCRKISIHALREEGDHSCGSESGISWYFNPRPPWGERPLAAAAAEQHTQFQSTPSARRATVVVQIAIVHDRISIHALREESDLATCSVEVDQVNFNPRPPRGGRRAIVRDHECRGKFQSTPSARRATPVCTLPSPPIPNFNPRPPRGERHRACRGQAACRSISIHALREEGDRRLCGQGREACISIHALREEGDVSVPV